MATKEVLKNSGESDRERLAKRSREAREAVADIGEIPPIINPERRAKAADSLRYFLQAYFPASTGRSPLSEEHNLAIDRMEVAIREQGWVANIKPRGFIKSTLTENAIIWAMLYGYRRYILFFAGTAGLATSGLTSIKRELIYNDQLLEDFPEACWPIIRLDGKGQRCRTQTYKGELTNIICSDEVIRLAMIPGTQCAGCIVEGYGLLAPPRGARYKNEKGENVRPDLAGIDDPQTDESAKSYTQTQTRLRYIHQSISMMGGHGAELSMFCNATIVADGDLADQISNPNCEEGENWLASRVAMLKAVPKNLESFWLGDYAKIRKSFDRNDPRGKIKAKLAATELYRQKQKHADEGAIPTWENMPIERDEISAIQHAMNIWVDKGAATFWAECQNAPLRVRVAAPLELNQDELAERTNNFGYGVVPPDRGHVVFHVDVHDEILYWAVAAIGQQFTGDIIAYGTWPEQATLWFTQRSASRTLDKLYPHDDSDTAIEKGITDCVSRLLSFEWSTPSKVRLPVSCGLVDAGYKPKQVANALRKLGVTDKVIMSRGIGTSARKKPMTEYDMSPNRVLRCGPDFTAPRWYYPIDQITDGVLRVHFDTNFWKSIVASRLNQTSKEGAWTLWGNQTIEHGPFISHLTAERPVQDTCDGRTVNVWAPIPNRDNHWFDNAVGCAVAGSIVGCQLPSESQAPDQQMRVELAPQVIDEEPMLLMPDGRPFFATARR